MRAGSGIDGKVILLGTMSVGKPSIVNCVLGNAFNSDHIATVGSQYSAPSFVTDQGVVTLRIRDTAGQERYRGLAPMYCRGSELVILVFSLTDAGSLA
jgi:small GTP-binding protein